MENQENKMPETRQDNGALWAILLTLSMVGVMAFLKYFIG